MFKVIENLFIGDRWDCRTNMLLSIHIDSPDHKNKTGRDLYLEIDDGSYDVKNINEYVNEFKKGANFIRDNIQNEQIFVHCLAGVSRSALVIMLYLMHEGIISDNNFEQTSKEYRDLNPGFYPVGNHIKLFTENWRVFKK